MIKIAPKVFRKWQRTYVIKLMNEARTFMIAHGARCGIIDESFGVAVKLTMFVGAKVVVCRYKDYLDRPYGWKINRVQFSKPTKVQDEVFEVRMRRLHPELFDNN